MINISQYTILRNQVRAKMIAQEPLSETEQTFLHRYPFVEDAQLQTMMEEYQKLPPMVYSTLPNDKTYSLYIPWLLEHANTKDQERVALQYLKEHQRTRKLWIPDIVIEETQKKSPWYLQKSSLFIDLLTTDARLLNVDAVWNALKTIQPKTEEFYTLASAIIKKPDTYIQLLEKSFDDKNALFAQRLYDITRAHLTTIDTWDVLTLRTVSNLLQKMYDLPKEEHAKAALYAKTYNLILPTAHHLTLPLYAFCENHGYTIDLHEKMSFQYPNIIKIIDTKEESYHLAIRRILEFVDKEYVDISNIQWLAVYQAYQHQAHRTSVANNNIQKHPEWLNFIEKGKLFKTLGLNLQEAMMTSSQETFQETSLFL